MDPRVKRTRAHVLNCARVLLDVEGAEGVTFSSVGKAAQVARQTLYRHWSTREQLLADVIVVNSSKNFPQPIEGTPAAHLRAFLFNLRNSADTPAMISATALLLSHAFIDRESAETLRTMIDKWMDSLRAGWGPLSEDEYVMITGPMVCQMLVMRKAVTDEFISMIVADAMGRRSVKALTSI